MKATGGRLSDDEIRATAANRDSAQSSAGSCIKEPFFKARESEKYRRPPTGRSQADLFQRFEIGLEIFRAIPVHPDFPGRAGVSECVEINIGQTRGLIQSKTLRLI
jgi:hypothetical protein